MRSPTPQTKNWSRNYFLPIFTANRLKQNSWTMFDYLPTGNMTAEIMIFFLSSWTRTALSRKSWSSLWRTFAAIASNCLSKFSLGKFLVFMSNVGSINSSGLTISFCLTTANFLNSSNSTIDPLLQNSWKNREKILLKYLVCTYIGMEVPSE